jgi:hypothetical protein
MATPAILAGLIAGYTVGAVVTALAVAQDDPSTVLPRRLSVASAPGTRGACSRAVTRRSVARCLRSLDSTRALSSPRR